MHARRIRNPRTPKTIARIHFVERACWGDDEGVSEGRAEFAAALTDTVELVWIVDFACFFPGVGVLVIGMERVSGDVVVVV